MILRIENRYVNLDNVTSILYEENRCIIYYPDSGSDGVACDVFYGSEAKALFTWLKRNSTDVLASVKDTSIPPESEWYP